MCVHNGTHVDAPFHFVQDGKIVDQIPSDRFVGPCWVSRHDGFVTAGSVQDQIWVVDIRYGGTIKGQ